MKEKNCQLNILHPRKQHSVIKVRKRISNEGKLTGFVASKTALKELQKEYLQKEKENTRRKRRTSRIKEEMLNI